MEGEGKTEMKRGEIEGGLRRRHTFFFNMENTCICLVEVEKRIVVCWSEHAEKAGVWDLE